MMHLNLLPYRQQARQRQYQRWLLQLALVVLVAVSALVLWSGALSAAQSQAQAAEQLLQTSVTELEGRYAELQKLEVEVQSWQRRQQMVESLQQQRQASVQLLQTLAGVLPDGVYWSTLKQEGDRLYLTGIAQSPERVSALLRHFNGQSEVFQQAHLEEIVLTDITLPAHGGNKVFKFAVQVSWVPAQDKAAQASGAFQ